MRMAIEYNCSHCNVCSPHAIMNALKENNAKFLVPIDQWVECLGFGVDTIQVILAMQPKATTGAATCTRLSTSQCQLD
jgi:hypothetical protein